MPVPPYPSDFTPLDGRLTSQFPFNGTLDGDEVMYIVAPGNAQQGNSYQITVGQIAGFVSNFLIIYTVTDGATSGDPYNLPVDASGVLFNVPSTEEHFVVAPPANSMLYNGAIFIKDLLGSAADYPITITFSDGELCDGMSQIQITTAYGWYRIAPVPGGGGWYMI